MGLVFPDTGDAPGREHRRSIGVTVSVVIPTWRRAVWLARCAAAVVRQSPRPDEIIVVGRPEDDAARQVVEHEATRARLPVSWVTVNRPGHVAPIRRGLAAARHDIVAFLDDDCEPETGWLAALLEQFSEDDVACVGGRVVTPGFSGKVRPDAGRIRWNGKYMGNVAALDVPAPLEVMGVMEGNWAWRASVLRDLWFDPALDRDDASMYGFDLCLQARERGLRVVYTAAARVTHHAAPRDPELDREAQVPRARSYSRNYTYLALKHLPVPRRALFVVWWFLVGERASYGLATGAVDLLLRGPKMLPLIAASLAAKWKGLWSWWRSRG